jgi:hypothetical protein
MKIVNYWTYLNLPEPHYPFPFLSTTIMRSLERTNAYPRTA